MGIPTEGTVAPVLPMGMRLQGPVSAQRGRIQEGDGLCRQVSGEEEVGPMYRSLPPSGLISDVTSPKKLSLDWTVRMCQRWGWVNYDVEERQT